MLLQGSNMLIIVEYGCILYSKTFTICISIADYMTVVEHNIEKNDFTKLAKLAQVHMNLLTKVANTNLGYDCRTDST